MLSQAMLCQECREAQGTIGLNIEAILKKMRPEFEREYQEEEILYLCMSLAGYSVYQIAFRLKKGRLPTNIELRTRQPEITKKMKSLNPKMSNSIHDDIKEWMKDEGWINSPESKSKRGWHEIIRFLRQHRDLCLDSTNEPVTFYLGLPSSDEITIPPGKSPEDVISIFEKKYGLRFQKIVHPQ
jgi:hypothetical protein